jgi:hypothetical protein
MCEELLRVESAEQADPVAQLDAVPVRDERLQPLAARYRASIVADVTKRDAVLKSVRDLLPGLTWPDAGALPSGTHVMEDARPLVECLLAHDADCAEVSRVVAACTTAAPGVTVSAQLLACAGELERAKLNPARTSAAHAVAALLREWAPNTAGVTIDAPEAMTRFKRALPLVSDWQTARDERRARAEDIRKACAPAK